MLPLIVLCLVTGIKCFPAPYKASDVRIIFSDPYVKHSAITLYASFAESDVSLNYPRFRYVYVTAYGAIKNNRGRKRRRIEVTGSPLTSRRGLYAAANVVVKMTKFMPARLFKNLAANGSVGVFTAKEKLTVYPEFARYSSGSCGDSCDGPCNISCTFDGRKYEDLAGAATNRALVLQDNLLCTDADPYRKAVNVLSHELAHTILRIAVPATITSQTEQAYKNAVDNSIWDKNSHAMQNYREYFAEGATAFFVVTKQNDSSGGMISCNGTLCPTLQATRKHLRRTDPTLFDILSYVFTNNRPNLQSGLTICP